MNIFIQYKKSHSGKYKFLSRLIPELEKLGMKIAKKEKNADVALGLVKWREKIKIPRVLRVDGIYLVKGERNEWINKVIKKSIKQSHAVIFQSKFSKRIVNKFLKVKPKREYVIYNGDNPDYYTGLNPVDKEYEKNIILSAHWGSHTRSTKRLNEMLDIAREYVKNKDICFWIAGKTKMANNDNPQIKFLGNLPEKSLARYLISADVMLNIAWYDWCPNAVVEALVAGTPVICSNGSGVEEIVKGHGVILELDKPVKAKKLHSHYAPKIDYNIVWKALDDFFKNKTAYKPPTELYISNIAKQYKQVFEDVL